MGQPVDILWIDPLISFSAGDENDSAKMRQELDALNEVCRRCGVTPIVIHHDNRNGDYRGSSAIFDWCRAMIGLKAEFIVSDRITDIQGDDVSLRTASVPCIRVIHEKANNMKKFAPFLARMDQHLNFQRIEEATSPEHMEQGLLIQQAMKDIGTDAVSRIDLISTYTSLSGVSKTTARRHIKTATDNKLVSIVAYQLECLGRGKGIAESDDSIEIVEFSGGYTGGPNVRVFLDHDNGRVMLVD